MVKLRAMRPEEFQTYSDYFIDDYSKEIASNYKHPIEDAILIAKKELQAGLPDGVDTQGQNLLCLENENAVLIGFFWYKAQEMSVFILDFYILDQYRFQGYGQSAINAVEDMLVSKGFNQIKLRVAYDNDHALKLYQKMGFGITGYNMEKKIGSNKAKTKN